MESDTHNNKHSKCIRGLELMNKADFEISEAEDDFKRSVLAVTLFLNKSGGIRLDAIEDLLTDTLQKVIKIDYPVALKQWDEEK